LSATPTAILHRIDGVARERIAFEIDGHTCTALEGDTVLTAILSQATHVRSTEFSGAPRAGFCMMGACQDCWVQLADGERLRACTTLVEPGMRVLVRSR
jgi:predicted molibdopterin-dependent oxidoreductase YjgC